MTTDTSAARWRPYQFYALVLLTLIVVLNYLDRYSLALLQESIKHDLKLSDWRSRCSTPWAVLSWHAMPSA